MQFADRIARARAQMEATDVDALLLSVGADLPYLTGYEAMPLERLTMLVLPREGEATLVIPELEAPRVTMRDDFTLLGWGETADPLDAVVGLLGGATSVAIGETTWARFVVGLIDRAPSLRFRNAGDVMTPLRAVKSDDEIARLRAASHAVDRIAGRLPRRRDRSCRAYRGSGFCRARPSDPRRGPRQSQLRDRGRW